MSTDVDKDILYFANTQEDGATIYRIQDGPGGKADVTPISFDAWTPQDSTQVSSATVPLKRFLMYVVSDMRPK